MLRTRPRTVFHTVLFLVCVLVLLGFVVTTSYMLGHVATGMIQRVGDAARADQ